MRFIVWMNGGDRYWCEDNEFSENWGESGNGVWTIDLSPGKYYGFRYLLWPIPQEWGTTEYKTKEGEVTKVISPFLTI